MFSHSRYPEWDANKQTAEFPTMLNLTLNDCSKSASLAHVGYLVALKSKQIRTPPTGINILSQLSLFNQLQNIETSAEICFVLYRNVR